MRRLLDWFDDRTGYRELMHEALYERIPGGARWRYVWGSTLVFTFVIQMITGVCLWSAYSPSAQTAWESVYYIQNEMYLGNVIRGMHHVAAQMMVVLLAIHLIQVIIDGAYKAPREINFWLGLVLAQIVLALSLTGYLLPWDQKGYYATQVTTKIVGATPAIGPELQQLVQGGPEYGHHTLTRFFVMHAGVLPGLLLAFLGLHIYVFRRHGITTPDPDRAPEAGFWPDQVLKDAVACLGVLAVVMLCAIFKGAELSAPADPSEAYSAARPEWYFLFLFRFLRFEAVEHFGLAFGAIYIPGAIMGIITLMPIFAMVKGGHRFNVAFMWLLAIGVVGLTGLAMYEDSKDIGHQAALVEAERDAHRASELAALPDKIPVEGAGSLLKNDPFTQGPRLFAKHCAACHRYDGHDGRGRMLTEINKQEQVVITTPSATDLHGFADHNWWGEVLTNFGDHFALAANAGYDVESSEMATWSSDNADRLNDPKNAEDLDAMVEYLVSLAQHSHVSVDKKLAARGKEILVDGAALASGAEIDACTDCHAGLGEPFELGTDNYEYPELNGYGSAEWLKAFIRDPGTAQFYGEKNKMPGYADKMSERELDLLVRWMTGDYPETHVEEYESKQAELAEAIKSNGAKAADGAESDEDKDESTPTEESGGPTETE